MPSWLPHAQSAARPRRLHGVSPTMPVLPLSLCTFTLSPGTPELLQPSGAFSRSRGLALLFPPSVRRQAAE